MTNSNSTDVIQYETVVPVAVETAFARFTEHIGDWWPAENTFAGIQGVIDSLESVVIEPVAGGRWYERTTDGHESAWGDVREYASPGRLVLGWQITPEGQPEPDPTKASDVEVTFVPASSAETRVVVRHTAFDRHGPEGAAIWRQAMDSPEGWPKFLDRYARFVSNS